MNHAKARQLTTGGWQWTTRRDGNTWPHQCCVGHVHGTPKEAAQCHRAFVVSGVRLEPEITLSWQSCEICGEPTKGGGFVQELSGEYTVFLCEKHADPEAAKRLIAAKVGDEEYFS